MFLSLLVYTVSALIMYIAAQQVCINQRNTMMLSNRNGSFFTLPILFSIIFFGLLCGVRYNVGADNLSYIKFYLDFQQKGEIERTDFEPLFLAVQYLFAKSGLHYMFYNGFWASVEIGFVYYALRREKYVLPYVALFIILGPIFLYWTNGIRQCVASCIFIFLIDYIVDRKFVKYCVGVMICFLIHKSALILLPLYFLLKKAPDISRYRVYLVIILMACAIIGSTPLMLSSGSLGNIIAQLGYEHYALYVANFDADSIQSMAWGPGKIGIF